MMADKLTHFDEDGRAAHGRRLGQGRDRPQRGRRARPGADGASTLDQVLLRKRREGRRRPRSPSWPAMMAAKRTGDLIPLCHPLPLTTVAVTIEPDEALPGFAVTAEARTHGRTGVEMEALTAVSVACLTLFDMLKASTGRCDRGIELVDKTGGKSGDWRRR